MNREQIELAIKVLSEIPDDHEGFDIKVFSLHNGAQAQPGAMPHLGDDGLPGCGTICCAAGFMALRPEFILQGFYLDRHGIPTFNSKNGFHAISEFLDLPRETTQDIFDYPFYLGKYNLETAEDVRPSHVIKELKKLLRY